MARHVRFALLKPVGEQLENLASCPCLTLGLGVGFLSALSEEDAEAQIDKNDLYCSHGRVEEME